MTTVLTELAPSSDYDSLRQDHATGSAAVALSVVISKLTKLVSLTLHLDAAPTTAESFTITLNSLRGAAYDTLLYAIDLSVASVTDLFWFPDGDFYLLPGDAIDVAYTNTDTGTYGLEVKSLELQ